MKIKKIMNSVLVNRPETENKWWDRLFKVVLYSSGILVVALSFIPFFSNNYEAWVTHDPTAFSLESNYQMAKGKELPCKSTFNFDRTSSSDALIIQCEGADVSLADSLRYQTLYKTVDENLRKQYGLDKYDITKCSSSSGVDRLICGGKIVKEEQADSAYPAYQNSLKDLARIKVATNVHFRSIFTDLGSWILAPVIIFILWVLFWNSLIYRAILYIIFGNKK
jgi:hypothetical protein